MEQIKAHSNYDFVNYDKVFYETPGEPQYAMLYYEEDLGSWVLVNFTDKHFKTQTLGEDGNPSSDLLCAVGWDALERVADYDHEELD